MITSIESALLMIGIGVSVIFIVIEFPGLNKLKITEEFKNLMKALFSVALGAFIAIFLTLKWRITDLEIKTSINRLIIHSYDINSILDKKLLSKYYELQDLMILASVFIGLVILLAIFRSISHNSE